MGFFENLISRLRNRFQSPEPEQAEPEQNFTPVQNQTPAPSPTPSPTPQQNFTPNISQPQSQPQGGGGPAPVEISQPTPTAPTGPAISTPAGLGESNFTPTIARDPYSLPEGEVSPEEAVSFYQANPDIAQERGVGSGGAAPITPMDVASLVPVGGLVGTGAKVIAKLVAGKAARTAATKATWTSFVTRMSSKGQKSMSTGLVDDVTTAAASGADDALKPIYNELGEFTGYQANTVIGKLQANGIYQAARNIGARNPLLVTGMILGLAGSSLGTRGTVLWGRGDLQDMLPFTREDLIEEGEFELAEEARLLNEEISNPTLWAEIHSFIPGIGLEQIDRQKQQSNEIRNKLLDIQQANAIAAENEDPNQTLLNPEYDTEAWWAKKAAEDAIAEEERRAYEEGQDQLAEDRSEANRLFWEEYQEAQNAQAEADRLYWEERDARQAERDAEERAYWEAFYAERDEAREDSAPSNLNFGSLF